MAKAYSYRDLPKSIESLFDNGACTYFMENLSGCDADEDTILSDFIQQIGLEKHVVTEEDDLVLEHDDYFTNLTVHAKYPNDCHNNHVHIIITEN